MKNQWQMISPHLFTWEKYCSRVGYSELNIFHIHKDDEGYMRLKGDCTPIGYCRAKDLTIRPRDEGYAIMVEIDSEECWCHIYSGKLPKYE